MINDREKIHTYRRQGLKVEQGFDPPGRIYARNAHELTVIYTVFGNLTMTTYDGDESTVTELTPGMEFTVQDGQEHEAVVGPNGWKYVVGMMVQVEHK